MSVRRLRSNRLGIIWPGIFVGAAVVRRSFRRSRTWWEAESINIDRTLARRAQSRMRNTSMELADIGKTFRRLDYETKVTGKALYLADMNVPGMCHGKILRSPLPHARVKKIDISKALKVAGVVAIITRDDILHNESIEPYYGPVFKDQTIVAMEKVRHVGDPVAAVAAVDVEAAEEALKLIEVDYEELPAVLNVQDAIKQDPQLAHEKARIPETGFAD